MTLLIKGTNIAEYELKEGVKQKLLLNRHETGDSRLEIRKIIMESKQNIELSFEQESLNWLHALSKGIEINSSNFDTQSIKVINGGTHLTINNIGGETVELLICTVPRVKRFLQEGEQIPFDIHSVDWSVEPVLLSEFDTRKRIYLASSGLWNGISCVKGEMIIYPKGGTAPLHHHQNAEHFQYIVQGSGTAIFNNTEHTVKKGDILYFFENEIHAFENKHSEEFIFFEFFVPGNYKTIWSENSTICTWVPTGKDIKGRKASRHIEKHIAGEGSNI